MLTLRPPGKVIFFWKNTFLRPKWGSLIVGKHQAKHFYVLRFSLQCLKKAKRQSKVKKAMLGFGS